MRRTSLFVAAMILLYCSFGSAQLVITADKWPYGDDCIGNHWDWYRGEEGSWGGYVVNPIDSTWDFTSGPTTTVVSSEIRPISESQGNPPSMATFAERQVFGGEVSWGWEYKMSSTMFLYGFYVSGTDIYYSPPYRRPYIFGMLVGTNWTDIYSWQYMGVTVYDTIYSEIINQGYVTTPEGGPYPCLVLRYYKSSYAEYMGYPMIDEDYIIYEWIAPDVGSCVAVQSQNKEINPFFTTYKDFFRLYNKTIDENDPPEFTNTTVYGNGYDPGPYTVKSTITDASGIDTDSLYYRFGNAGGYMPVTHDSVIGSVYHYTIPAAGSPYPDTIFYYLVATDLAPTHNRGTDPPDAPADSVFCFVVKDPADDHNPPLFFNTTQWPDTSYTGPFPVSSIIIDSCGVAEAYLYYRSGGSGSYSLAVSDSVLDDLYYFTIPYMVSPPAFIEYYLEAVDASPNYNVGYDPPGAPDSVFSFNVQDYEGPVIENTRVWPDTGFSGPFDIWSDIYDNSGLGNTYLFYKIQTAPWDSVAPDSVIDDTTHYFTIPAVTPPKVIRYYIKAYDGSINQNVSTDPQGAPSVVYEFIANPAGTEEEKSRPSDFPKQYLMVTPNPFRENAEIRFFINSGREPNCLRIYDISGRVVRNFHIPASWCGFPFAITWDGRNEKGEKVPSGIYHIAFEINDRRFVKKVVLMR
jgi:hypothetical protein